MSDLFIHIWNIPRIILLCASGIAFVITSYSFLSIPAFAISDNRDGATTNKYEWGFAFFSLMSGSFLSYSIWHALYYKTWQPIIWLAIAFLPWVIIGNIILFFCERNIKSET